MVFEFGLIYVRAKSTGLRTRINNHISDLQGEIEELKIQAATMPESNLEAKEAVFEKIDALEQKVSAVDQALGQLREWELRMG